MKRIAAWLLSTVTVVVLMIGYHTSTSGVLNTAGQPAITGGVSSTSSSSSGSGTGSTGSTTSGNANGSGSGSTTSSVTGSVAQTRWGPVQVQLTVKGGSIAGVQVLQYPSGNGTDTQINGYALPVLIQETLDAQSANIDMVSGATVTSGGYAQSLQSALDQAGL